MTWNIGIGPVPHPALLIFECQMPKSTLIVSVCRRTRRLPSSLSRPRSGGYRGGGAVAKQNRVYIHKGTINRRLEGVSERLCSEED